MKSFTTKQKLKKERINITKFRSHTILEKSYLHTGEFKLPKLK